MYQRILVPVDGSPTALRGLDEAIKLAKLTGASLHLVNVLDQPVFLGVDAYHTDVFGALRRAGAKLIEEAKARASAGGVEATTFVSDVLPGRVSDVVVEQARASGADLIVLGTHGRRGIGRVLMGSDAEQIVRVAPTPVLLVRAPAGTRSDAASTGGTATAAPAAR